LFSSHFPKSKDRPAKELIEGSTLAPSFPKVVIKKPKVLNIFQQCSQLFKKNTIFLLLVGYEWSILL
jgi:hypothetical protein